MIKVMQMDSFRGLLVNRRRYIVPNTWHRELCGVTKGADERIDESILLWFG